MTDVFHPPEKTDIRVQRESNPFEEAQIKQLRADTANTYARAIEAQARAIDLLIRTNAISPSRIIEAVAANDLTILFDTPKENNA